MEKNYSYILVNKMLEEKGVKTVQAYIPFKVIDDAIYILKFEDFMSFLLENQIRQVFVYEQYVEPEDYKITDQTFKEIGVSRYSLEYLVKDIEKYNDIIDNTEFETPEMVVAMFVWNGQRFYYLFQNAIHIDDKVLLSAKEKLSEMIMSNEKDIVEANRLRKKMIEQQQKALKVQIIKDTEFRKCTNNRLRRNYIIDLFKGDAVPQELKEYWVNDNGILFQGAFDFVEMIWREVKER